MTFSVSLLGKEVAMNLFNSKLLSQRIQYFNFPKAVQQEKINKLMQGWQISLTQSDLAKTKEKSVQGQFLNKFFTEILNYPSSSEGLDEWNCIQHPKTEVDAQEADGSLGFFTKDKKLTRAVIELKDAKTSLDKKQTGREKGYTPVEQAYAYATKFNGCNWIIVSNFKEIRLYNKSRTQDYFESFDVLKLLEQKEFQRFYFLLCRNNLIAKQGQSVIDDLFHKTEQEEVNISVKFYAHFKQVRLQLFNHLSQQNPEIRKELLLEKAQKILDRITFILFCEDTNYLLPRKLYKNTYERALHSFSDSDERVWLELKGLFKAIGKGNERVNPRINGYNGGLFKEDPELDCLTIKDDIWKPLIVLSEYDFESDININILGHIFEQSISDLEEIKHDLAEGGEAVAKNSKRKKDGIYYTPEYITRYIVKNAVGAYLDEHLDKLESITILDPACGSGAFLNQAYTYLQGKWQEEYSKGNVKSKDAHFGGLFDYNPAEVNRGILLQNLFGVDLNEESVEITKLSLWIKTARADEPLQSLEENIRCGNSLIDDPVVDSYKAFEWKKQFPDIFDQGGFDVIISNPPWGADIEKNSSFFVSRYPESTKHHKDTYKLFIDLSLQLLKEDGILGFITPNSFLYQPRYSDIKEVIDRYKHTVINLGEKVFKGVNLPSSIIIIYKTKNQNQANIYVDLTKEPRELLPGIMNGLDIEMLIKEKARPLIKVKDTGFKIDDVLIIKDAGVKHQRTGVGLSQKGGTDLRARLYAEHYEDDSIPLYTGSNIERYQILGEPSLFLRKNYVQLLNKNEIVYFDRKMMTASPKIVWRQTSDTIRATLLGDAWFANTLQCGIIRDEFKDKILIEYALAVFNSSYINQLYQQKVLELGRLFPQVKLSYLKELPFPFADMTTQMKVKQLADRLITEYTRYTTLYGQTKDFLKREYGIEFRKTNGHIDELEWSKFNALLQHQKIKLSIEQKELLMRWLDNKTQQISQINSHIKELDDSIDTEINKSFGINDQSELTKSNLL
jgi:type I restriction-modification system DNA methylase subunit